VKNWFLRWLVHCRVHTVELTGFSLVVSTMLIKTFTPKGLTIANITRYAYKPIKYGSAFKIY
jgi:hypothetical protein